MGGARVDGCTLLGDWGAGEMGGARIDVRALLGDWGRGREVVLGLMYASCWMIWGNTKYELGRWPSVPA